MEQTLVPEANHCHFLFPDPKPLVSPSCPPLPALRSEVSHSPFRRGPMYPAYAELRDWKLRMKKAGLNPSTPLPIQYRITLAPAAVRSLHELSMACRNEKRKPQRTQEEAQMVDASKNELIRTGSTSAMRGKEKRDVEEFTLPRSCSSYQGPKGLSRLVATRNEEEARRGKAANKGILSKTITGFRRSTAKATGWMG